MFPSTPDVRMRVPLTAWRAMRFVALATEAGTARTVEVQLDDPQGHTVFRVPVTINVVRHEPGEAIGIDHIVALSNVRLEEPGRYIFRIDVDGTEAASLTLRAEQVAVRH